MKYFLVKNERTGEVLAKKAIKSNFITRVSGLMFSGDMGNKDAFIINRCPSIHSFFMKFSMDVLFINKKGIIKKIYWNFRPWRMSSYHYDANIAIEFKSGVISTDTIIGDKVSVLCINSSPLAEN